MSPEAHTNKQSIDSYSLPTKPYLVRIAGSLYSLILQYRQIHSSGPSCTPLDLWPARLNWRCKSQQVFILLPHLEQKRLPLRSASSIARILSRRLLLRGRILTSNTYAGLLSNDFRSARSFALSELLITRIFKPLISPFRNHPRFPQ